MELFYLGKIYLDFSIVCYLLLCLMCRHWMFGCLEVFCHNIITDGDRNFPMEGLDCTTRGRGFWNEDLKS